MMARFLTVSTTGILHVAAQNTDLFNFALGSDHNTCEGGDPECSRPSFAQEYWEFMRCDDPATCVSTVPLAIKSRRRLEQLVVVFWLLVNEETKNKKNRALLIERNRLEYKTLFRSGSDLIDWLSSFRRKKLLFLVPFGEHLTHELCFLLFLVGFIDWFLQQVSHSQRGSYLWLED